MQRVRIGLTGLASVFLLVLLGAIFVKFVRDGEAQRLQSETAIAVADGAPEVVAPAPEPPKEPLAELGIAPGNVPESGNITQPPPAAE
ncbi:MAG: hypothetical protein AB7G25_13525 [Sphingomonadaceae bacterium]